MSWDFDAAVFLWEGDAAWHFLRLPLDVADEVRDGPVPPRGFGSVRVQVKIGDTTWTTSVFPEKDSGSYVLPVKKAVRVAEGIDVDDVVRVRLELEGDEGA